MARMIPDTIDRDSSIPTGERLVYDWLSKDEIPGTAYYSVLQKNHKRKLTAEIDFLYISEKGIICIEVKGGEKIYCKDKIWYSVSKNKETHKIKNPFNQAKDCMYALKSYLTDVYGKGSTQSKFLVGYAVIFPECKFTGQGNDLVTEVMFDGSNNLKDFQGFLENTIEYWVNLVRERNNYTPTKLAEKQLRQLNDLLRGDFSVVPSMRLKIQDVYEKMLTLTEEQYHALDITHDNKRVIIKGGAGTGKSILALEKVRKTAAMNKRVLYICFNKNMAKYAETSMNENNKDLVKISTFHGLILEELNDPSLYKKSVEEISKMFLVSSPKNEQYDYLVIDEGQDLMDVSVFEVLDRYLTSGMDKGSWVMFSDPNQNLFSTTEDYKFAYEYIIEESSPAIYTLNCNWRNTKQIAQNTAALTSVPPAKLHKLDGPNVVVKIKEGRKELVASIRSEIASVLASGVASDDIILLSRYKHANSCISKVTSFSNLNIVETESINNFQKNCLNYYTIQSFKGLESKVVFLIDLTGFDDPYSKILNYVAMTRAKVLLYVFIDESFKEKYYESFLKGLKLL